VIGIDLQEHVADAHGRALVMGHDDLNLVHIGHHRQMATQVANGLPLATGARRSADSDLRSSDP